MMGVQSVDSVTLAFHNHITSQPGIVSDDSLVPSIDRPCPGEGGGGGRSGTRIGYPSSVEPVAGSPG